MKKTAIVSSRRFLRDTRGANMVEYIIVAGAIAVFALGLFNAFGSKVTTKIKGQTDAVEAVRSAASQ